MDHINSENLKNNLDRCRIMTLKCLIMSRDFDNGPLNKFLKNLKNRIFFIDVFFCLWIDSHSNFMQFYLLFDSLSKTVKLEPL
jgi:hypothetical protein